MIPISRRAPGAFRSLCLAASKQQRYFVPSSTSISRLSITRSPYVSQPQRLFSSQSWLLQQAAAEVQSEDASTGQRKEYTTFRELADAGLIDAKVVDTIENRMKIHTMTDVQRVTLNHCLDGTDVIGQAKTGTGKTLAFLLPIVQRTLKDLEKESGGRLNRPTAQDTRAVIISPTRELAEQIAAEARRLTAGSGLVVQTAVGGTQKSRHLYDMQRNGCHILVGTPGRIEDILSDRSARITLNKINTFVLDEADRLLDIGFAPAIASIQTYMPDRSVRDRQTLMFSATVPKSVVTLVRETMRPDFKFIRTIDPNEAPVHDRIPQNVVFGKGLQNHIPMILEIATNAIAKHKEDPENNPPFKAIVFFGSTAEVTMSHEVFAKMRDPSAPRSMFAPHPLEPCRIFELNGKLAQQQRTRNSDAFRHSKSAILFATDVAARGMDFPNVSHVIQVGLPKNDDDYIHRVGRTGRAGKAGEGWLLLNDDEQHEIHKKMRDSGITLQEARLRTADLDMSRPAQLPASIARNMQLVETGVKAVPYNKKADTYMAMFGVLKQQMGSRRNQTVVDMMNDLAKYGWGMAQPPPVGRAFMNRIGFSNCSGLNYEQDGMLGERGDRGGRGGRDMGRGRPRGGFDKSDPFGMGVSEGTGVFGGGDGERRSGRGDPFADEDRRGGGGFGGRSDGFGGRSGGFGGRGGGGSGRRY